MCVIIAKRCKLQGSEKKSFFLYKVRDRDYDPKYKLEVKKKNGVEALFFLDQDSGWREGVNSKGICIVGAALANKADSENNGSQERSKKSQKRTEDDHKLLEKSMMQSTPKDAARVLREGFFQGTNFITDGDTLIVQEIYLNQKFQEKAKADYIEEHGEDVYEELSGTEQLDVIYDAAKPENYDIAENVVKKDILVVRTNIAQILDDAGYQKEEGEDNTNYFSSVKRYNYTKKALEKLTIDNHPFDTLTIVAGLTDVDKEGQYNPIRRKEEKPKEDQTPGHKFKYYSSSIVMLSPASTIFVVPVLAEIDDSSRLALKSERECDFVILPKKLHMFESSTAKSGFRKFTQTKSQLHNQLQENLW